MTTNLNIDSSDVAGKIRDIQAAADKEALELKGCTALVNAGGVTLTAAQMLAGILLRSGAAGVSDTTLTAAQIVAALGPNVAIGDVVELTIRNKNTGTLTIVAGTNVTLEGVTTVAQDFARRYAIRVTAVAVPAVTLSGIHTAAV